MAIAIIDDTKTSLAILKQVCTRAGISDILSYSDPENAIAELGSQDVDMIVVDYDMPKLNGVEFIKSVRNGGWCNRETPIIMVTATTDRNVRLSAIQAGATDFVSKPIDPTEFRARVANLMKLKPIPTSY
jgi:putative two-component system response regulator